MTPKTIRQAVQRFKLQFSRSTATMVSTSEIDDVSAAKNTRIKNTAPTILPPGMALNIFGSTTNISDGPDAFIASFATSALAEPAKMEGMTIIAAKMAKSVSQMEICRAEEPMLASFFM